MEPMQPPEPYQPRMPPPPTLPPRSTPIQPGGFPGWSPAPPPPPGPPGWTGPQPQYGIPLQPASRTYGLATAALVCGLLGLVLFWLLGILPLLGVIFGLIAARTIKRSGGTLDGLGKARAGWITGLIGVAAAGAFFWAGATGRLDDDASDRDSKPGTAPYSEADVGDCVAEIPAGDIVYELEFVSCDDAHSAEVYLAGELNPDGNRAFPGDTALLAEVETACDEAFEPYIGRTYEESVFEVYYLYPRLLSWQPERGIYFCFVGEVGKTTIGSAFQSDR